MRYLILILLFQTISFSVYSQESIIKTNSLRFKINPLQFAIIGECALTSEYFFLKQYGINLKLGYQIPFDYDFMYNHYQGPIIQIGFKKYFKNKIKNRYSIMHYTGIELLYKNISHNYTSYHTTTTHENYNSKNKIGLKAVIGNEFIFLRSFIIEFYGGYGISYFSSCEFEKTYDTIQGQKINLKTSENKEHKFLPNIHLGIKIGFNIPLNNNKIEDKIF